MLPADSAKTRVRAVLAAARTLRTHVLGDRTIIEALAIEQALSPEGVCHALEHCLEVEAADADLAKFCDRAQAAWPTVADPPEHEPTREVRVVLSANVLTAPSRALAWAWAQAPMVRLRPSRRAALWITHLVHILGDPRVRLLAGGHDDSLFEGVDARSCRLHVYGGAGAAAALQSSALARGMALEIHGPGLGAAVVDGRDAGSLSRGAIALAEDVIPFDQRGCLSPRVALVIGPTDRALLFARMLHAALETRGRQIPRGPLDDGELAAARQAIDTARYAGEALAGPDHAVLVYASNTMPTAAATVPVAPVGRHVSVVDVPDPENAILRLRQLSPFLSIVAATPELRPLLANAAVTPRVVPIGETQHVPFDGPVDMRVLV